MLILAATMAIAVSAANAEDTETRKEVPVKDFKSIHITGYADVIYRQGKKHSAVIFGNSKYIGNVTVTEKNRTLSIGTKSKENKVAGIKFQDIPKCEGIHVEVTSPELCEIHSWGTGDFYAKSNISGSTLAVEQVGTGDIILGNITTEELKLSQKGTGDIFVRQIGTDMLDVSQSGTGDVCIEKITPKCKEARLMQNGTGDINVKLADVSALNACLNGLGDIDVDKIQPGCSRADLRLDGTGDMDIYFGGCEELNIFMNGSGDMKLTGNATNLNSSRTGTGDIDTNELDVTGKKNIQNTTRRGNNRPSTIIDRRP